MDELFGFPSKKKDDLLERVTDKKPTKQKRSIEEEFSELFSAEEIKEISGQKSEEEFEVGSIHNERPKADIADFVDLEDIKIGDDHLHESSSDNESDEDTYDFLKRYDFDAIDKDYIDDEIYERARNQKSFSSPKTNSKFVDDELDIESIKKDLPPIKGVNYEPTQNNDTKTNLKNDSVLDDDDDIFARLQRLSNLMEQQDK